MNGNDVTCDERTIAVENESYRLAYLVLTFGLLVIVAYRGLVLDQANWDLLGLVMLGGLVTTFYQASRHIITRRWVQSAIVAFVVGLFVAVVLAFLRRG